MSWHPRRRTDGELHQILVGCRDASLTYAPTGGSLSGPVPEGLVRRTWECTLDGADAYERAVAAIRTWSVHRGAGLAVAIDGPIRPGTNVAIDAPLPVGAVTATCRIVAVVDDTDRFGFAYGTLPGHPERGEESFVVHRAHDGVATFRVVAFSQPAHPLAKLVPPVANRLQDAAARRYLRSMADAVRTPSDRSSATETEPSPADREGTVADSPNRLAAVVLTVADLDRSIALYSDGFGLDLRPSDHGGDDRWTSGRHASVSWTDGAFLHFALYASKDGTATQHAHVSFQVDDLDAAHDRALAAGAELVHPPKPQPWSRSARYRDPDGNIVELTQPS